MGGIQDYIAQFEKMTPEQAAAHDAEIERMEREQAAADRLESYKRTAPERYHAESLDTYRRFIAGDVAEVFIIKARQALA